MSSDNVSTTAPESRKSTKPIMEKRRRARINACLAELKSLLMDVIKAEGARHSKMEKADILEMTVRHLRQLQRQSISGIRNQESSTQSKYKMGYVECINEVGRFLGSLEIEEVDLRTKIIDHLANCVAGAKLDFAETELPTSAGFSHAPTVIRPRPEKPSVSLNCSVPVSISSSLVALNVPQAFKSNAAAEFKTIAAPQYMPVINLYTPPMQQSKALSSPDKPSENVTPSRPTEASKAPINFTSEHEKQRTTDSIANRAFTCDIQPKPVLIGQPDVNINLIGTPSATTISPATSGQIFGGLQLIPKQLPSGEIVFIVPANVLPSSPSPSYIIPVVSPNISPSMSSAPSTQSKEQATKSSCTSTVISNSEFKTSSPSSITPLVPCTKIAVPETKSIIPTCGETFPVLQHPCDSKQNDLLTLKSFEQPLLNQNTLAPSDMRTSIPQYVLPISHTSTPALSSCVNLSEKSATSPISIIKKANTHLVHRKPLIAETLSAEPLAENTKQTEQGHGQQISEHLVLNLTMQNRTRANPDNTSRGDLQEDTETMWRPW